MNICESITAILNEKAAVKKDSENKTQNYKFRGIDAVMNTFNPLLAKHKVFVVPTVLKMEREERQNTKGNTLLYTILTVQYTFYAEDGTSITAVTIGEGMDTGDKSVNKAMSAAYKYALFQVFCIPTEEMIDSEVDSPEVAPKKKAAKPKPVDVFKDEEPVFGDGEPEIVCEECGAEITDYESNGKVVPAGKHVYASRRKFGKTLCLDCIKKVQG